MTAAPAPPSVSTPSLYNHWHRHFLHNREHPTTHPWHDPYRLSPAEHRLLARSIQQFQLGEWARGRGLLRRASAHPVLSADPWFLPSLELFIAEEQGHSAMLGRFLDREQIPRLFNNWVDSIFRRLRKLAGLEACAVVLVTAEVLAVPFYRALRDATRSSLLHSICKRILRDEAAHLHYQALTIGLIRRPLGRKARAIRSFCHSLLFHGTALLLWRQHPRVFRSAGWTFLHFWTRARCVFSQFQQRICYISTQSENGEVPQNIRSVPRHRFPQPARDAPFSSSSNQ